MDNKKLKILFDNLDSSKTEDDIVDNLTKIVRGYGLSDYKEVILKNPYYKSLISDIAKDIKKELLFLRDSVEIEIIEIDRQIKFNKENKDKLKELKRECQSLIYEIDERDNDINQLI